MWTAAIATDTSVRDLFISSVKKFASDGLASQPFGDWYETTDGTAESFRARPVVGGHLGKLCMLCSHPATRLLTIRSNVSALVGRIFDCLSAILLTSLIFVPYLAPSACFMIKVPGTCSDIIKG
jgi:hypothetical protein